MSFCDRRKPSRYFLIVLSMGLLGSCGGGAGGPGGSGGGGIYKPVTGLTLASSATTTFLGEKVDLYANLTGLSVDTNALTWTTSGGTLSGTKGAYVSWSAPTGGTETVFWVKVVSDLDPSYTATANLTLLGTDLKVDQDLLVFLDALASQNTRSMLFAVGTASPVSQTFTPSVATLGYVGLYIVPVNPSYGSDTAVVKIETMAGEVLGTASKTLDMAYFMPLDSTFYNVAKTVYFQFPDGGLAVTPETTYRIVLEGSKHTFGWGLLDGDKYSRGTGYWNLLPLDGGDGDFVFRFYGK